MFNFEKLESWHRAIDFAGLIYSSTRDFPRGEIFGLTMQMRRAAVSVSIQSRGGKFSVFPGGFRQIYGNRRWFVVRSRVTELHRQAPGLSNRK